jgi:hypothetical protein
MVAAALLPAAMLGLPVLGAMLLPLRLLRAGLFGTGLRLSTGGGLLGMRCRCCRTCLLLGMSRGLVLRRPRLFLWPGGSRLVLWWTGLLLLRRMRCLLTSLRLRRLLALGRPTSFGMRRLSRFRFFARGRAVRLFLLRAGSGSGWPRFLLGGGLLVLALVLRMGTHRNSEDEEQECGTDRREQFHYDLPHSHSRTPRLVSDIDVGRTMSTLIQGESQEDAYGKPANKNLKGSTARRRRIASKHLIFFTLCTA